MVLIKYASIFRNYLGKVVVLAVGILVSLDFLHRLVVHMVVL